jgi:hypothetical protein
VLACQTWRQRGDRRVYVIWGEGSVDVVEQDASSDRSLGRIKTAAGARTLLFVPESGGKRLKPY